MSLIARFVFEWGSPADIELPEDEREGIMKSFNEKKVYDYKNDNSLFWCNMDKVSFLYIFPKKEVTTPIES